MVIEKWEKFYNPSKLRDDIKENREDKQCMNY